MTPTPARDRAAARAAALLTHPAEDPLAAYLEAHRHLSLRKLSDTLDVPIRTVRAWLGGGRPWAEAGPCRHCGVPQTGRGRRNHEVRCSANPERIAFDLPAAPAGGLDLPGAPLPDLAAIARQPAHQLLTFDEEQRLGAALAEDATRETARELLILRNRRLVYKLTKKYRGPGIDEDDLIQVGIIGLMRAVEKWDYTKGHKFSTYATWWVRQAIQRHLDEDSRLIRLPTNLSELRRQVRNARARLIAELGREPDDAALCAAARCTQQQLRRVRTTDASALGPISLDAPRSSEDGDERSWAEILADPAADVETEALGEGLLAGGREVDAADLAGWLAKLPARQRQILSLRYGFTDDGPLTLEQVGQQLRLTRERVRQIEHEALATLRRLAGVVGHGHAAD